MNTSSVVLELLKMRWRGGEVGGMEFGDDLRKKNGRSPKRSLRQLMGIVNQSISGEIKK